MADVRILLDSRIRIAISELERADGIPDDDGYGVVEDLCDAFTHDNPAFSPDTIAGTGEPEWYKTFRLDADDYLTLPRGGMQRVRNVLRSHELTWKVEDERVWEYGEPGFPDHLKTARDYQVEMIDAIVAKQNCLIHAPTGCLDGDTIVGLNRAGKGFSMKLAQVVHMFNGGRSSNRNWNPQIVTHVRAPFQDGTVRLAPVVSATPSGVRPCYAMTIAGGECLVATACHQMMTPFGWRRLDELREGDSVLVDAGIPTGRAAKPWYKLRTLREHPHVGRRGVRPDKGGWTVPLHRLVAEARENGMELEGFVAAVKSGRRLKFLDPKRWVVHHKDEDEMNNAPSNLEVVSHEEHHRLHLHSSLRNITSRLAPRLIIQIEYAGERETFDLEVERASAFIANGIAVHNSGKTTALFGALARLKRRALVMVWTGNLLEQWRARCVEELGFEPGVVRGDSDGGHPWLDLAMQQTIVSRFERGDTELDYRYDVVAADEVQRFAAPTLFASIDPFRSRYRIGVSADHSRADQKEFLTRDLFGEVACDVQADQLITSGAIVDVEICVVPTEFRAPWYRYRQDFNKLLAQMVGDGARNAIALQIAEREISAGEQVLLFTHRVEHARSLDAELVARGHRSGVMLGGKGQEEVFARTAAGLRSSPNDELHKMAGVGTYQAIAQGLDLPTVSRGICVTPIGNNRQQVNQAKGRLCRNVEGKSEGRLYYLHDKAIYGRRVIENLNKWFRVRALWNGEWVEGSEYVRRLRSA